MAEIACEICKKGFNRRPSRIKKNKHNFCSFKCKKNWYETNLEKWVSLECVICSQKFLSRISSLRKTCSKKCVNLLRAKSKLSEKNPMWRGKNVGYTSLHEWVRRRFKKPEFCQDCKQNPPKDLANISQEYKREVSDWEWLCRYCHMIKDGRLKELRKFGYKLTAENVRWIRKNKNKFSSKYFAIKLNVSNACIQDILKKRRWASLV